VRFSGFFIYFVRSTLFDRLPIDSAFSVSEGKMSSAFDKKARALVNKHKRKANGRPEVFAERDDDADVGSMISAVSDRNKKFASAACERPIAMHVFDLATGDESTATISASFRARYYETSEIDKSLRKMQRIYDDLWPNQKRLLNFLRGREDDGGKGGIVTDAMGSGKTMALLVRVAEHNLQETVRTKRRHNALTLVVCPKTLSTEVWLAEVANRFDAGLLTALNATDCVWFENRRQEDVEKSTDLLVVSYGLVVQMECNKTKHPEKRSIFDYKFARIVADEAHRFSNEDTVCYEAMMKIEAERRWYVSATPVQNGGMGDFERALTFVRARSFGRSVVEDLCDAMICQKKSNSSNSECAFDSDDCLESCPCGCYAADLRLLDFGTEAERNHYARASQIYGCEKGDDLSRLHRMRMACLSFEDADGNCGTKIELVVRYAVALNETTDKMVVFSSWLQPLRALSRKFEEIGIASVRLIGEESNTEARVRILKAFAKDRSIRVLLCSINVGKEGINLACANHVVIMEPQWNPFSEGQAAGRLRRKPQDKQIKMIYLVMRNTIEGFVFKTNRKKIIEYSTAIRNITRPTISAPFPKNPFP